MKETRARRELLAEAAGLLVQQLDSRDVRVNRRQYRVLELTMGNPARGRVLAVEVPVSVTEPAKSLRSKFKHFVNGDHAGDIQDRILDGVARSEIGTYLSARGEHWDDFERDLPLLLYFRKRPYLMPTNSDGKRLTDLIEEIRALARGELQPTPEAADETPSAQLLPFSREHTRRHRSGHDDDPGRGLSLGDFGPGPGGIA